MQERETGAAQEQPSRWGPGVPRPDQDTYHAPPATGPFQSMPIAPEAQRPDRPAAWAQWEKAIPRPWWRRNLEWLILGGMVVAIALAVGLGRPTAYTTQAPSTQTTSASLADTAGTPTTGVPTVTDLPQFDQAADGNACAMHYSQTSDGRTITRFTITQPGELITHVSGPDGLHRNDEQVTANYWAYAYDVPLNQVTDMGAVLYLADGTTAACAISPGATAP